MGLTLIEVLAGIVLISTLLVTVLVTSGKHTRRIAEAQRQLQAAGALDRLMAQWHASNLPYPGATTGHLPDYPEWFWKSSWRVLPTDNPQWPVQVLRVEVFSPDEDLPLAQVELLDVIPGKHEETRRSITRP